MSFFSEALQQSVTELLITEEYRYSASNWQWWQAASHHKMALHGRCQ